MPSDRQIAANRLNARKSSGPRTSNGKARSSQNAVTHGLTAQYALLADEDPIAFEGLRQELFSGFTPHGAVEGQLVERAASLLWRLRRIPTFELALFEWQAAKPADPLEDLLGSAVFDTHEEEPEQSNIGKLGGVVEALLSANLISKLGRYEVSLHRQLSQTLKDLRDLKAARDPISRTS